MLRVSKAFAIVMTTVGPLFTQRVWPHVHVLLVGAMLPPGKRTVTAALRVLGLAHVHAFQSYPRVWNRAIWSGLEGSRLLRHLRMHTLAPTGPLVMGVDETIERRRGAKIRAKGISRDPGRSAHLHVVKAGGLRGVRLMLLAPIPWTTRVGAWPLLTGLAPSERAHQERGQRQKTLTDGARQRLWLGRRWVPERSPQPCWDSAR